MSITSLALFLTSFLICIRMTALIFSRREYRERNLRNGRLGHPLFSLEKDLRTWRISVVSILGYAVIAAILDTLSGNSIYQDNSSFLLKLGLGVLYTVPAIIIFIVLARLWWPIYFEK